MEWNRTLKIEDNLVERDLGDEIVIMTADGKEIHSLEKTASWIWIKIKEGIIPDKIINLLIEEYSVDEKQARTDFIKFIDMLKDKGILIKNPRNDI